MDITLDNRKTLFLVIVGLLIFYLVNSSMTVEKFEILHPKQKNCKAKKEVSKLINEKELMEDIVHDIKSWERKYNYNNDEKILKGFVDAQYHPKYKDLNNAIRLMIPANKDIFNIANLPATYSTPNKKEVDDIMQDFTYKLNDIIKTKVMMPTKVQSGWENFQASLGLPTLHSNTESEKGNYDLIALSKIEKLSTEQESKYVIQCVLQKENVEDQVLLKVHLIKFNAEQHDEDNFFKNVNDYKNPIRIEHIYIVGFLTKDPMTRSFNPNDNVFHYDDLEHQMLTSPKQIQDTLMKKYKEKHNEMRARTAMIDEDGKVFDLTLTDKMHKSPAYTHTRTIFDDMQEQAEFE